MTTGLIPGTSRRRLGPYHVLDSAPEERYDEITRLAAASCDAPLALVGLLDDTRVWFKSRVGTDLEQVSLEEGFCAHTLREPGGLLVVPDARRDVRWAQDRIVQASGGPRFYAGATVLDPGGDALGTLCVLDTEPRAGLTDAQESALRTLARSVGAQLELGRREVTARTAVPGPRSEGPLGAELRAALAGDEFVVHLQPLWQIGVDAPLRLCGAEALVRWQHPERGLLLPGAFLPAVEMNGLSVELGELVMERALGLVADWDQRGLVGEGFRLHVNVAASQLHAGGVAGLLRRLGRSVGARLDRLHLEITESALLDATAFPPSAAHEITELGAKLVLDDFGTGYSSLTLLRRYPVAGVKVDRSFVSGLGRSREDQVIVEAVLRMAEQLGLHAVCEGVETLEQLDAVLRAGGTEVQGFLLGRALPARNWEDALLGSPLAAPS